MKPKIGVYICHCGTNIAGVVEVEKVVEFANSLPEVTIARSYEFMCSDPGQNLIKEDIKELGIDRVVVASCSPLMHEPTFRRVLQDEGVNQYFFNMANIREQCSWVTEDHEEATEKAKALIRAAVRKVALHEALETRMVDIHPDTLVIGAGVSGIEAALQIANSGRKVYLVDKNPSIGGHMAQFDKTFPTLDCAACILTPKMVQVGRHENIGLLSYSEVTDVSGYIGNFKVKVNKKARFVDLEKCTSCDDCTDVCPVNVPSEYDMGMTTRKAIFRPFPQAVPNKFLISLDKTSPCKIACPADVNAQGYTALIGVEKFKEAIALHREQNPFPSVCARICHHPCEQDCNRKDFDEPVAINALKRFMSDYEFESGEQVKPEPPEEKKREKIAIIGSGPAGLTSAFYLAKMGYQTTVFEAAKETGGVLVSHIPDYRLPKDKMQRDIDYIRALGAKIETNKPLGEKMTFDHLFKNGYKAIVLATGAGKNRTLPIPGIESKGVLYGLDFLGDVKSGKKVKIGNKVVVVGGGNVAMDVARSAIRLGAKNVEAVCLEPRQDMPAHPWEIEDAEQERVKLHPAYAANKVLEEDGKVSGIECLEVDSIEISPQGVVTSFTTKEGTEKTFRADTIIIAIGAMSDLDFFQKSGLATTDWGTLDVDPVSLATNKEGVFAGGDLVRGPASAVEAIGDGHRIAESIDLYIRGESLTKGREPAEEEPAPLPDWGEEVPRTKMPRIPLEKRLKSFDEIDLGFTKEMAVAEALRCLNCEICSECHECEKVCQPEAIIYDMVDEEIEVDVGNIIVSTGYQLMDPTPIHEYGYGRLPNVITSLEFERLTSASGPTEGHILLDNGKEPEKIAIFHCVGSRDTNYHPYCSRICCMYALKTAHLVKEKTNAEVYQLYIDMRTPGKGYEEFYDRLLEEGVRFIRGRGAEVTDFAIYPEEEGKLIVRAEDTLAGVVRRIPVDMIILCPAVEAREDAKDIAVKVGISMDADGFFIEKHPKLAPVETTTAGIFLAGCCQGPKDIPDSVAQGAGAAASVLSLIGAGEVEVESATSVVDEDICAGCKICNDLCPYTAITFNEEKSISEINETLCKGCGTCAAACPSGAITAKHFTDKQVLAEIEGVML